jgi:uncharacterized protein
MVERGKIRSFCDAVVKEFRPRRIILFGSYANGRPTADSDVDLLEVMPRTRERGERVSIKIRHAIPRVSPLDLQVRTPRDVAKRFGWGRSIHAGGLEKGKTIYEAPDA